MRKVHSPAHRKAEPAMQVKVLGTATGQCRGLTPIASIPGLGRLIPGTHDPREIILSPYGRWKLPVRFGNRDVALVCDGTFLARRDQI